MSEVSITITGVDKLVSKFDKFKREIRATMSAAGAEAARLVLSTVGLQKYPPATGANQPGRMKDGRRIAYYQRGSGSMIPTKGGGYKSNGSSERYGTQFYSKREGAGVLIGNRSSYGPYLADEDDQSEAMAKLGWRKLIDVAREKLPLIEKIYQAWVDRLIKKLGL